jgi:hypothetical protein
MTGPDPIRNLMMRNTFAAFLIGASLVTRGSVSAQGTPEVFPREVFGPSVHLPAVDYHRRPTHVSTASSAVEVSGPNRLQKSTKRQ